MIEKEESICHFPKVKEQLNLLKETVADDIEHLRISEDQGAKVGHKSGDGKQLQALIKKSKATGMEIKTVIGDTAYSEKENIMYSKENEIKLVAKLNPQITQATRMKEDEFEFNKDAGCRSVRQAIWQLGKLGREKRSWYYFDIEKCKRCPFKDGCYKEGAKSKTYSVSIKSNEHTEQAAFQESEYFKASSSGLMGM